MIDFLMIFTFCHYTILVLFEKLGFLSDFQLKTFQCNKDDLYPSMLFLFLVTDFLVHPITRSNYSQPASLVFLKLDLIEKKNQENLDFLPKTYSEKSGCVFIFFSFNFLNCLKTRYILC